jgi:hypothetical protein
MRLGTRLPAAASPTGSAITTASKGAQRGDVQRVDERVVHPAGVVVPGDGPHALEQVLHLLGRVVAGTRG